MSNVAKLPVNEFVYVAHPLANTFPMIQGREFEELTRASGPTYRAQKAGADRGSESELMSWRRF